MIIQILQSPIHNISHKLKKLRQDSPVRIMSCFRCSTKSVRESRSIGKPDFPTTDTSQSNDSMVSAMEGERNSLTSFISFDVDGKDDQLAVLEERGRVTSRLLNSIVDDKNGFRSNGTLGEVDLWFAPKSIAGMPMIALGEINVSEHVALESIIFKVMDLNRKAEWDPEFMVAREISSVQVSPSERLRTCWSACKSRPGIAGRDFVYHAFSSVQDESWTVACWSAELDEVPSDYAPKKPSPSHVRAKLILGGFAIRRAESRDWRVTYINQVDTGISSWLSEPVIKKTPNLLNNLKRILEQECTVSSS
jgi:hypothetical protein